MQFGGGVGSVSLSSSEKGWMGPTQAITASK